MPMQIRRTATLNSPPTGLAEGQLAVEMSGPVCKLWVGVPTSIDPSGRRLLTQFLPLSGGTMDTITGAAGGGTGITMNNTSADSSALTINNNTTGWGVGIALTNTNPMSGSGGGLAINNSGYSGLGIRNSGSNGELIYNQPGAGSALRIENYANNQCLLMFNGSAVTAPPLLYERDEAGVAVTKTSIDVDGNVNLPKDPTTALQAVTKQYCDSRPQMGVTDGSNAGPGQVGEFLWGSGFVDGAALYIPAGDWNVIFEVTYAPPPGQASDDQINLTFNSAVLSGVFSPDVPRSISIDATQMMLGPFEVSVILATRFSSAVGGNVGLTAFNPTNFSNLMISARRMR